jgi:hypothetical protein
MGLPGVRIPPSLFPRIQSALEACSHSVAVLPVTPEDVRRGLLAAFDCMNEGGDVVRVTVNRATLITPEQIVAILQPIKARRFRTFQRGQYLQDIQATLIDHGALPISRADNDTGGNE